MNVFVLSEMSATKETILGVFSTLENARRAFTKKRKYTAVYPIYEFELDKEKEYDEFRRGL
ncbi:hypothetical protein LCGC14_0541880 [marine sediment metagenome]|uniref:DUF7336 domain-containing protein n=1 Tax=marine sediment metagenome TaxID=412755 RepID=A0A0F9UE07_9ZZZZ